MKTRATKAKETIGRGFAVTMLLVTGCGSGGHGAGGSGAGTPGYPGTAGGSAGGSGGGGAIGWGTAGGAGTAEVGGSGGGATGLGGASGGGATGLGGASGGGATGLGGASGGGATGLGGASGGADMAWLTPSQVPPTLTVPAGATIKVHDHAVGAQIYTCTAGGGGSGGAASYSWVFKAPDANLYDAGGAQVGTHGAGPHWTSSDGSMVNGSTVSQIASPTGDAIPWLLLRATSTSGTGLFSDVSYVQRLNTTGGKAPSTGCDATTVGMDLRVGYAAEYYFYTGGAGAAWLVPPANLPTAIQIPDAHVLKIHDHAIGTQNYTCTASGGGDAGAGAGATTYAWVFRAPDAILYDPSFAAVGTHGMGPTWTSTDGSAITGAELARVNSPLPDAIPWLLLKQLSSAGTGVFSDVDIVQRLNTAGGAAPPAAACDATTVNSEAHVGYAADYYFYTSVGGAGGTGG